ncbi:MAG: SAM-dependent methyltransferase [Elusimicrobiales bacterium]|nr:SAM-dependent methyltransferase [Elusimicrobiales bacterium]
MKKEMVFASFGLYPEQITLETLAALRKCRKVYITSATRARSALLRSLLPGAEILTGLSFETLVARTAGALPEHGKVGVLDYGDPAFLCAFSSRLKEECLRMKAGFRTLRAVSSLNSLIADLGLGELAPAGLFLATAHSWEGPGRSVNTSAPVLIFSPDRARLGGDRQGLFARIAQDLRAAYPAGHPVYFVKCAAAPGEKTRIKKARISDLGAGLRKLDFDSTMFIPAAGKNACRRK